MTEKKVPECFDCVDKAVLDRRDFYGPKVRELIGEVVDVKAKKMEHIKVNPQRCTGCELCVRLCPSGCYEMDGRVAVWKYGQLCTECGGCMYFCHQANAIDWTYPEGGTGLIMHFS